MARLVLKDEDLQKVGVPVKKNEKLVLGNLDKQPRLVVGAGWDPLKIDGQKADLDLVTLMLTKGPTPDGEVTESGFHITSLDRIVHYDRQDKTKKVPDASGAVVYQGDSLDGSESDGDEDETTILDFSRMPADVDATMTFVNIHKEAGYSDFMKELTFDQVNRAFVSSFPEGADKDPKQKRVTRLNENTDFAGTDTVIVKFHFRKPDGTWEEQFVEKHVKHLDRYKGLANAGFLSALFAYGVEV